MSMPPIAPGCIVHSRATLASPPRMDTALPSRPGGGGGPGAEGRFGMGVGRSVAPVRQYTRWPLVSVSVLAMGCGRRALMVMLRPRRTRVGSLGCSELDELATALDLTCRRMRALHVFTKSNERCCEATFGARGARLSSSPAARPSSSTLLAPLALIALLHNGRPPPVQRRSDRLAHRPAAEPRALRLLGRASRRLAPGAAAEPLRLWADGGVERRAAVE